MHNYRVAKVEPVKQVAATSLRVAQPAIKTTPFKQPTFQRILSAKQWATLSSIRRTVPFKLVNKPLLRSIVQRIRRSRFGKDWQLTSLTGIRLIIQVEFLTSFSPRDASRKSTQIQNLFSKNTKSFTVCHTSIEPCSTEFNHFWRTPKLCSASTRINSSSRALWSVKTRKLG